MHTFMGMINGYFVFLIFFGSIQVKNVISIELRAVVIIPEQIAEFFFFIAYGIGCGHHRLAGRGKGGSGEVFVVTTFTFLKE